jgi:hypothetical protein
LKILDTKNVFKLGLMVFGTFALMGRSSVVGGFRSYCFRINVVEVLHTIIINRNDYCIFVEYVVE